MKAGHETPDTAAARLAARTLRKGFVLQAVHAYTDRDGCPSYWRLRAKHPVTRAKWIRPMKLGDAGYALGEPPADAYPDGKPLYRLHELASRPAEVAIVTEGELKADLLAALGLLVTTSGAANSAGKADWQPLAARDVMIWPDHDAAGQRYAEAVVQALVPLGCKVRVVNVSALGLDAKEDAADWMALHPEATASDVLALTCIDNHESTGSDDERTSMPTVSPADAVAAENFPPDPPNTCKFGGGIFELTERGVFFIAPDSDGNEKAPEWICSPLGVVAKTRDSKSGEWGRLLEWYDDDGVRHEWPMPLELLEGDGVDVRRELARLGLHIATSRGARDRLAAYIKAWPVDRRARCVDRLGWHGAVYATPHEAIGESEERVVFQSSHAIEPAFAVSGTVAEWRSTVGALAGGNTRLVFAVSAAFAGALADIVGEDSGGFHLRGKSSSGKSTALKAAASVWGNPAANVRVWRATANGLEGLAALHNDGVLILDELSQCDPREAGEAAYLLANGQGKARASRNGTARASQRWRLLFLSAGEESLCALMARAGRNANVGQQVRLADFEADAGAGMGAFEDLHGHPNPAALAHAVKDAAAGKHGAVGMEFLRRVVGDRTSLADPLVSGMRRFVDAVLPAHAAGQVERVARRFALVAMAGSVATHYGLTGWDDSEPERAAKACFASWLEGFGGAGNLEERNVLAQVRAFFEAHGASRFEDVAATGEQRVINRAGFVRIGPDDVREYLVLPEAFKNEVCKGIDEKAASKLLIAKGWIAPGGDGRSMQKPRLPGLGTTTRVYVFTGRIWEGDE